MEARMEVASLAQLWWSKLGKWQALMTVATLGVFFITLGITGDMKDAIAAAFAAIIFTAVTAAFTVAGAFTFVAFAAAFTAITFAAVAAAFAVAGVAVFVATVVAAAFVAVATIVVAATDRVTGVNKKAVWASYMGEFLLVSLPLWWVLRG